MPTTLEEAGMLRRALLIIGIALASIPTRGVAQTWSEYRPAGAGFALEMPGEWTSDVMNIDTAIGTVKGYTATVEAGGRGYMSMYIPYPPDRVRGRPIEPMLDGARDGAVANVHGRLRSEEHITVDNHPGRQIVIDANDMVLVQRFFVLDATLVQAIVGGHAGVETEPNTIRFLQSLRVVAP
jgi:hypothetical protein